jgi:hypothetical protein
LDAKTSDKLERVAEEHANKPEDELIEQISRTIEMIDDDD